jgi:hypothetical protein
MAAMLIILFLFYIGVIVVLLASQWKIFSKAGKPGWACLIPIYSTIVLLEIIKKPVWWIFMFLIPLVNIYFLIVAMNELSKSFGKSTGFTVGLLLLPIIFYPILGFGSAEYQWNKVDEIKEIGNE